MEMAEFREGQLVQGRGVTMWRKESLSAVRDGG